MTYTINGKEWTELEICVRVAQMEGAYETLYSQSFPKEVTAVFDRKTVFNYNPCTDWKDASHIIDKCWGELMSSKDERGCGTWTHWDHVKWQRLMNEHNCTKLIAACICYIEMQEEI
jgi:hypothetical protein